MEKAEANRIYGAIFGHALGDAVGLITEFRPKNQIKNIEFPYDAQIRGFPPCDWTDETDHMILVMQSLTSNQLQFNASDIASRFAEWARTGFEELGDTTGLGLAGPLKAIVTHDDFDTDPMKISEDVWRRSSGKMATNSSLSRTSVLGCADINDDRTASVCQMTHFDPRCVAACIIQTRFVHDLIHESVQTPQQVDKLLQCNINAAREKLTDENSTELLNFVQTAYSQNIADLSLEDLSKASYVYKCLSCSIYALQVIKKACSEGRVPSFKKVIIKIAAECGDADANCAVAGSVLGAFLGYHALPQDWIDALPNREWLELLTHNYIKAIDEASD